ncbi:MAG: S41 family peptidase [Verrucomicrobiae bacterium]|nr:S41 family peptidase [Verrucomicrobiae bacterium]
MLLAAGLAGAAGPSLNELREVLLKHLEGVNPEMLDEAAVDGILRRFSNQVMLVTNAAPRAPRSATADTNAPAVAQHRIFDDQYGYLRLTRLESETVDEITRALSELTSSNQLKGLVLDLRFAAGRDLAAAGRLAQWFVGRNRLLMEWKGQKITAPPEPAGNPGPLVVLINGQTKGAPEVLAAILREQITAVLIGSPTSGDTAEYREVTLANGQLLRLAVAAVTLGDGQPLKPGGVRPDILAAVSEREERAYLDNPFRLGEGGGDPASRPRLTEADLVRMKRESSEGESPARPRPSTRPDPAAQLVRDPALARGLDLLKGLNLLKMGRGS